MATKYFITACNTDSGKTFVTEGLARSLLQRGLMPIAYKPIITGYMERGRHWRESDALRLLRACGRAVDRELIDAISPWRFAAARSPDLAAAMEEKSIDFDKLVGWCRTQRDAKARPVLFEGIGGVMTPLTEQHTIRDLIAALAMPTLLVADNRLGSISHTLTALLALQQVNSQPVAVIVNECTKDGIPAGEMCTSLLPHVGSIQLLLVHHNNPADLNAVTEFLLQERRRTGR